MRLTRHQQDLSMAHRGIFFGSHSFHFVVWAPEVLIPYLVVGVVMAVLDQVVEAAAAATQVEQVVTVGLVWS
jgi:hypothetical protein